MSTDEERRAVARNIRENYVRGGMGYKIASSYNIAMAIGMNPGILVGDIELWNRLADLIDPTCEARRDEFLYSGDFVETVFRCSACGCVVSYDDDFDPETDAPAYCEMCGSRITGIGEPWDE